MACVRKRRGRWVVDYRDGAGYRRWESFLTREEAQDRLAEVIPDSKQEMRPAVDPKITVKAYGERWLAGLAVKPRTRQSYEKTLKLHVFPALGDVPVRRLHRAAIKDLLTAKLQPKGEATGLARNSVRIIQATLRALLNEAIEDGLIRVNPAARLGKQLRLVEPKRTRQQRIKALDRDQLDAFLAAAVTEPTARRYAPLFLLLARTGMRLGEGLAVQWQDLGFQKGKIRVARAFSGGEEETPKSGAGRDVDMSLQLAETLRLLEAERKAEKLRRGWAELPPWLFVTEAGTPLDESKVRKVFAKVLKKAKLPGHFTPHSLRHSFASILLAEGEDIAYVQEQLGHASIELTVGTYGRWLAKKGRGGWDRLEGRMVAETAKMVAAAGCVGTATGGKVTEISGSRSGAGERCRTSDLLITNQLLCH